jgi:hypothetical protein
MAAALFYALRIVQGRTHLAEPTPAVRRLIVLTGLRDILPVEVGLAGARGLAVTDDGGCAADDVGGELGERVVVVAGVAAEQSEGFVGCGAEPFGQDSLGLLDHDAAVERDLQLASYDLVLADRPFLQDPDGGHVNQRPGRYRHRRVQAVGCGAEEVQRPDDLVAQPHRDGVYRGEAHLAGGSGEPWPSGCGGPGADVADDDGLPGAVAVQAGAFVVLDLE